MEWLLTILPAFGIPAAITGFVVWWVKRRIEASDKKNQEQQKAIEELMLMIIQNSQANQIGIKAIARAVQRIPDAKCNGDMTSALERMDLAQTAELEFLTQRGIKNLFD